MSLQSTGRGRLLPVSTAGNAIVRGAAEGLCLAATPVFAVMALLTAFAGGTPMDMPGMPMPDASPFGGMATMYGLMGLFHLPVWLKLLGSRRSSRQS